jgi:hypothetical protein
MVEVKDPVIKDREDPYIPDEISFINFVVSDYSEPLIPEPKAAAASEYDKQTKAGIEEIRKKFKEARKGGESLGDALKKSKPE